MCSRSIFTRQVYHQRPELLQETPGQGTEARREAGAPHRARNCTIGRDKNVRRVCFLVHERMVQVEEPAQRNTATLVHSSIAGEGGSHLDRRRIALGGTGGKISRDLDNQPSRRLGDPGKKVGKDGSQQRNSSVKTVSFENGRAM